MRERSDWKLKPVTLLTDEQARSILSRASHIRRDTVLLKTLAYGGMRVSEATHIRKADIFVDQGVVIVRPRKKTKYADAPLDMPAPLLLEMESLPGNIWVFSGKSKPCYRNWTERIKHPDGRTSSRKHREKICDGGHMAVRTAQRIWDLALEKAGLKVDGRGIHTLRHYHATRYYQRTRDLIATQRRLSHSSPGITQVYIEAVDGKKNLGKFGVI